jgi:hypothetical protein
MKVCAEEADRKIADLKGESSAPLSTHEEKIKNFGLPDPARMR